MAEASLRDAARTLGVPLTSLRRLVEAEPSLRACVQPAGPRRAAAVDLPALVAAWQRLQAPTPQQEDLSPRQLLAIERRRRLHWQAECLRLELEQQEGQLIPAAEAARAEARPLEALRQELHAWLDHVAPLLPGMAGPEANDLLQTSTVAALQRVAAQQPPDPPQRPAPAPAPVPDPLPDDATLRAAIERHRAGLHQLKAQQATGELLDLATVCRQGEARMRRRRDQFLSLTARYAPAARLWRSESQARSQLYQEVSAILAPG